MRGRLIQRMVCVLRQLDAVETDAVTGGGFDDVWRSLRPVDDGTQEGASTRREKDAVRLRCQLARRTWGTVGYSTGGVEKISDIKVITFWPDLESAGLIDSDGQPTIAAGDRIEAIETLAGVVDITFDNPPGMLVRDLERAGPGLAAFGRPKTNLLILHCGYPEQGR